jgi:short-subunit dehydrogenase
MSTQNTHPGSLFSSAEGTAVVTGASSGLGRIYADRLAQRGYDLVLVARRGDRLDNIAASLRQQYGVAVRNIVADLADASDLERVAADISADQSVTMLINNAGTSTVGPVADIPKAKLDALNQVNVIALTRLSHAILPAFKARNRGTLINIGSVLGFFALAGSTAYSASKGYVNNFTEGLQQEVAGTNIRVQLVVPASTATEIWEVAGKSLSDLKPGTVMTAENCVDAALAGLDQGEAVTLPSVNDQQLYAAYAAARNALFAATQSGSPAARYSVAS